MVHPNQALGIENVEEKQVFEIDVMRRPETGKRRKRVLFTVKNQIEISFVNKSKTVHFFHVLQTTVQL